MSKVCVCIEGQLKKTKDCGPGIKTHLIDKLNADLFVCVQQYIEHNNEYILDIGTCNKYIIYDNPIPNFATYFDQLCDFFNLDKSLWRKTFETLLDGNYKLGFDKPGTCIRRMFNRYVLFNELKNSDYEWFIITRSDLLFVNDFDLSELKDDCLNISLVDDLYDNDLIAFHKSNLEKILNYIIHFLNGSVLEKYKSSYNNQKIDEQTFFKMNMEISNVNVHFIKKLWNLSS